jgi:hypothetical protein
MAIHYKDKKRAADPAKPYENAFRLLGVNEAGKPYFFWSETPGDFAAYLGPSDPFGVWGTLNCKNNMKDHHKAFIADRETAHKLETLGVVKPCGNCNRDERKRYDADKNLQVDRKVEIE